MRQRIARALAHQPKAYVINGALPLCASIQTIQISNRWFSSKSKVLRSTDDDDINNKSGSDKASIPHTGRRISANGRKLNPNKSSIQTALETSSSSQKASKTLQTYRFRGQEYLVDQDSPVLALPLAHKPLFPGFYKVITVKDPMVKKAIRELEQRKDSFIVTFLQKEDDADYDIITDIEQVHKIGTLCQITNVFDSANGRLSIMLFPYSRVRMTKLFPGEITAKPNLQEQKINTNSFQSPLTTQLNHRRQAQFDLSSKEDTEAILSKYKTSRVLIEPFKVKPFDKADPLLNALISETIRTYELLFKLVGSGFNETYATTINHVLKIETDKEQEYFADSAAAICQKNCKETQQLLEADDISERLKIALELLNNERVTIDLQKKINNDVEKKIQTRNKEYFLQEQLKGIKRELGMEHDERENIVSKFEKRAKNLKMPNEAAEVFKDELAKIQGCDPASSEYTVTRNYLDWLTSIPWGVYTKDDFSIENSKSILDHDHYGMKDVKDRILEFIAVSKLKGTVQGKILCFVGPPGVGKTSIGKSIAKALNRKFYRFSVGGLLDVAEIKGHRRTYIGALPGKIVQALKRVGSQNPLIMIDEIDKLSRNIMGDPGSALLELLDPEQNMSYVDHYIDIPVDVSQVLFICTANSTDTIPAPLLDRMEVIELSGYVNNEKIAIAENYLIPSVKADMGLSKAKIHFSRDALSDLVRHYCRENGVRNLKKLIDKVFRKASLNIVQKSENELKTEDEDTASESQGSVDPTQSRADIFLKDVDIEIKPENLKEFVGPKIYLTDRLYDTSPVGVVMGLAWTSNGGAALYTEAILEQTLSSSKSPAFRKTGSLGDVMKESTDIAYSYAKHFIAKNFPENLFFEKANIHLHCPQGSVPKDGPSAGITITSALLSLALNTPVPSNIAMTGELTLTGKVLRIGGLKEKAISAKSSGANVIIFPEDNLSDWEELADYVKEGLTGIPVSWYSDVFKIIFPNFAITKTEFTTNIPSNSSLNKEALPLYHIQPEVMENTIRASI